MLLGSMAVRPKSTSNAANDTAGPIAECLRKKKGNGLSDKAAAVAASNKLLRIMLSMLRSGAAFRHQ